MLDSDSAPSMLESGGVRAELIAGLDILPLAFRSGTKCPSWGFDAVGFSTILPAASKTITPTVRLPTTASYGTVLVQVLVSFLFGGGRSQAGVHNLTTMYLKTLKTFLFGQWHNIAAWLPNLYCALEILLHTYFCVGTIFVRREGLIYWVTVRTTDSSHK